MKNEFDTKAAISTPMGEGGIGIVRLSGPESLRIAGEVFLAKGGRKPSEFPSHTVRYGHILGAGEKIDEVLLTVMRAPRTYTREDTVEISCHGGMQAARKALGLVLKHGARTAEPGEFTRRAFMNGRIDLIQAEAVLDIIKAKTEESLKAAVNQLEGRLSEELNVIRDGLLDVAAHIEASIDFPDEDTDIIKEEGLLEKTRAVAKRLEGLAATYDEGMILREGALAIICGKPNAGKSSLMNLILKRDRVIVSHIPGTTRDAVEEMVNLKGIPVRLVDTAGISDTKDILEKEGMKRSKKYLKMADLVILLFDASTPLDDADRRMARLVGKKKKVVALNKTDLAVKTDAGKIREIFPDDTIVEISVKTKANIGLLEDAIFNSVWSRGSSRTAAYAAVSARHKELIDKALGCVVSVIRAIEAEAHPELAAVDLKEAIYNIGLIVGKSVSDDVLDRIFEKFCIGK